jgi:hypothetical protein
VILLHAICELDSVAIDIPVGIGKTVLRIVQVSCVPSGWNLLVSPIEVLFLSIVCYTPLCPLLYITHLYAHLMFQFFLSFPFYLADHNSS